jgi:radical SAM protein with 4Fe4S-binding SPASM domain
MIDTREKIKNTKIKSLQLDPFGYCNAKCWFCPVKYQELPIEGKVTMSVENLAKILDNLIEERDRPDGLVDPGFRFFYTAHYNEILLYKHFENLLELCRERNLVTMVLTNGVPLTPEKTDLINNYKDVVVGLCMNTPAFERDIWVKRTGFKPQQFDKLIDNIKYAENKLDHLKPNAISIQINGVNDQSFDGKWLQKGPEFDTLEMDLDVTTGELSTQLGLAKKLFPTINVFENSHLIDRAASLNHIMTNSESIQRLVFNGKKTVIGCKNGGDRTTEWLHVNAAGDAFICCNDYNYDYKFGNIIDMPLRDFWGNDEHVKVVEHSYKTMCRNCSFAVAE